MTRAVKFLNRVDREQAAVEMSTEQLVFPRGERVPTQAMSLFAESLLPARL